MVYIINNANFIIQPKVWCPVELISIIFTIVLAVAFFLRPKKLCEIGALTKEVLLYLRVNIGMLDITGLFV